jgi:hypothetical protein
VAVGVGKEGVALMDTLFHLFLLGLAVGVALRLTR